jgi:Putative binding domain, N-terminal
MEHTVSKSSLYFAVVCTVVFAVLPACGSSPSQPTPACTYSLSTSSLSFGPAGGAASVNVSTAASCSWTAASDHGWMTITSGANGTGSGVVNVTLSPTTSTAERTATLTIAGQAVSVRQAGLAACTLDLSPASASFNKDAASASFNVIAPDGCAWSVFTGVAWIRITSPTQGSGNGVVSYAIDRNVALTSRTGAIAVADRTFLITQAADVPNPASCEYSLTPIDFTPCMSAPFDLTAAITTQAGCTWTAESDASWIAMTGGRSGTGSGVISFRVTDNWDAPRQSVVKVRWPTVTAGQNLHIAQAGCRYAVSKAAIAVAAIGGPAEFSVIQESDPNTCGGPTQNACLWTAQADVAWIIITTSMPQAGDNPVSFTVAANDSTSARSGSITVRGQVVRIDQAGK